MGQKTQVEISENDFPSKERIWDKLYQCRDFELTTLWQKSAFLFGLFVICFSGYGGLVLAAINAENPSVLWYIYQYMCGVSILGIITSILWIYMMKGSKAWYEVYEKAIYNIECEIFQGNAKKYVMGEPAKRMRKEYNSSMLGIKGGAFSPSKITIVMGWILLTVWSICAVVSLYNLDFFELIAYYWNNNDWGNVGNSLVIIFAIITIIPLIISHFIKSKPLLLHNNKNMSFGNFCVYLFERFVKWMKSSFWRCLIMIVLMGAFICVKLILLVLLVPIVSFLFYIFLKINDDLHDYLCVISVSDIDKTVYTNTFDVVNETLESKINEMTIKKVNSCTELSNDLKTMISNTIDDLVKNKIEDQFSFILNSYIKEEVSKIMDEKLRKAFESKLSELIKS